MLEPRCAPSSPVPPGYHQGFHFSLPFITSPAQYGRKVLQRLEAVGPARSALQAALSAQPVRSTELEAAIKAARPAAVLLDPQLLVDAEVGV
jgi:hypothetical protein